MKKVLFIAASAALVFASCVKSEVIETPSGQQAIGFGTYVGEPVITRALTAVTDPSEGTAALQTATGFGVFADYTAGGTGTAANLMTNTQINYDSGYKYATAADTRYWSTTDADTYNFYAYAPWVTGKTLDNNGNIAVSGHNNATDIMVATPKSGTKATILGGNTDVKFTFNHATAKLKVNVTCTDGGSNFDMTSLAIGTAGDEGNGFKTGGDLKVNGLSNDSTPVAVWSNLTGNSQLTAPGTYLVIPTAYTSIPVTVEYNLTQGSAKYDNSVTGTLNLGTLTPNTVYNLTINVGLDEITFNVETVNGWNTTEQTISGSAPTPTE